MSDFVKKLINGLWHSQVALVDGVSGLPFSTSTPLPITAPSAIPVSVASAISVLTGAAPVKVITALSALNAIGTPVDLGVARLNHSLFAVGGSGASAGVVTLLGSNDGVNYFLTATTVTITSAAAFAAALANFPYRYVNAKITTGIVGGTCDVWIASV